ncbi:hypothetical protein DY000_02021067 [Brassica cretica]|uniref:Uncharacterized protein n=1 Tax=Brassica cretica TaxID=69181 RepID=A0ABQ7E9D1_BRACR|nr:hypothetical protein DY000_02021067 [Brassica cretica]
MMTPPPLKTIGVLAGRKANADEATDVLTISGTKQPGEQTDGSSGSSGKGSVEVDDADLYDNDVLSDIREEDEREDEKEEGEIEDEEHQEVRMDTMFGKFEMISAVGKSPESTATSTHTVNHKGRGKPGLGVLKSSSARDVLLVVLLYLDINHNYARRTAIDVSSYDVIVS